ncbi:MAG: ECF-type sigma factor [Planctomycetota bacterium]|jgi:RNA polymerase sigma factor (TIGR02999 family)
MGPASGEQVTRLLEAVRAGHESAAGELLQLVYGELKQMAHRQMAHVPPGDTLQPTALVHEAYLHMFGKERPQWANRAHFFKAAARAMRDIVIEQARRHASLKRGGGRKRVTFDEAIIATDSEADDLLALHDALGELEAVDGASAELVMLRYFAGLTVSETAEVMGIAPRTLDRYWRHARAWLRQRINEKTDEGSDG